MTAFSKLRSVVMNMPEGLAAAMLDGIDGNHIIGGRYTAPDGTGVCPMLAAFRAGMPRQHTAPFAQAWDNYLQLRRGVAGNVTEIRPANERELTVLRSLLRERLFGGNAQPQHDGHCPSCQRPERLDLHGCCAACATPLIQPAAAPARTPQPAYA